MFSSYFYTTCCTKCLCPPKPRSYEENILKRVAIRNLLFLYINDLSTNYYCRIAYWWFAILQ